MDSLLEILNDSEGGVSAGHMDVAAARRILARHAASEETASPL